MEISDGQLLQHKKKKKKMKHVLVIPGPGVGHVTPMMQLRRMLSSAGIAVTFVKNHFNRRRFLQSMELQGSGEILQNRVDLDVDAEAAPIRLIGIPDGASNEDYIVAGFQKRCQGLIDMTDRLTELDRPEPWSAGFRVCTSRQEEMVLCEERN